jgi:hypothetical protein
MLAARDEKQIAPRLPSTRQLIARAVPHEQVSFGTLSYASLRTALLLCRDARGRPPAGRKRTKRDRPSRLHHLESNRDWPHCPIIPNPFTYGADHRSGKLRSASAAKDIIPFGGVRMVCVHY